MAAEKDAMDGLLKAAETLVNASEAVKKIENSEIEVQKIVSSVESLINNVNQLQFDDFLGQKWKMELSVANEITVELEKVCNTATSSVSEFKKQVSVLTRPNTELTAADFENLVRDIKNCTERAADVGSGLNKLANQLEVCQKEADSLLSELEKLEKEREEEAKTKQEKEKSARRWQAFKEGLKGAGFVGLAAGTILLGVLQGNTPSGLEKAVPVLMDAANKAFKSFQIAFSIKDIKIEAQKLLTDAESMKTYIDQLNSIFNKATEQAQVNKNQQEYLRMILEKVKEDAKEKKEFEQTKIENLQLKQENEEEHRKRKEAEKKLEEMEKKLEEEQRQNEEMEKKWEEDQRQKEEMEKKLEEDQRQKEEMEKKLEEEQRQKEQMEKKLQEMQRQLEEMKQKQQQQNS